MHCVLNNVFKIQPLQQRTTSIENSWKDWVLKRRMHVKLEETKLHRHEYGTHLSRWTWIRLTFLQWKCGFKMVKTHILCIELRVTAVPNTCWVGVSALQHGLALNHPLVFICHTFHFHAFQFHDKDYSCRHFPLSGNLYFTTRYLAIVSRGSQCAVLNQHVPGTTLTRCDFWNLWESLSQKWIRLSKLSSYSSYFSFYTPVLPRLFGCWSLRV